jgi:hypothetical protein
LAYVPFIDPYQHTRYFSSLINPVGFEFGLGYILHKSPNKKTSRNDERKQLMKQTQELRTE